MLLCPVEPRGPPATVAPRWVVLSDSHCGQPLATLPIENLHNRTLVTNYTVCLHKALFVNYNNVGQFVEWMEIHRLLGAQRFVVYNYSCADVLWPYVQHYQQLGIMDFRRWPLNELESKITYTRAQEGMLTDCVYRYMYRTKYLALMDVDEVLMPLKHDTWADLLNTKPCNGNPGPAIHFRQKLFTFKRRQIPQVYNRTLAGTGLQLESLSRIQRWEDGLKCYIRSKMIVQPEKVTIPGIHTVFTANECCLPPKLALLYHYRLWTNLNFTGVKVITDTRMYDFADKLVQNVAKVYNAVHNISNTSPATKIL